MTLDRHNRLLLPAFLRVQRTLLLIATGLLLTSAAPLRDDVRGTDDVAQALLDAREEPAAGAALAARLASGGKSSIPTLFETVGRGRFDVFVGENGNSTRVVSTSEHEALVQAFGSLA